VPFIGLRFPSPFLLPHSFFPFLCPSHFHLLPRSGHQSPPSPSFIPVPFARGTTQSLFFVDCHFYSPGGATKLLLFRVLLHKSLLFKNVPTQSHTFVLRVQIVSQLLPTPKSVCYISNNTHSASFSRFCPICRWQPCCKFLPKTE